MREVFNAVSLWAIPVLLVGIPFYGMLRGVKVYEAFVEGAKEGFNVAIRIIPFLVAILVAIGMFRASGAMAILTSTLSPLLNLISFPTELVPLALMRPLTGSGSLALVTDLVKTHGPDSLMARIGATMYGSSETTFYVIAVYFGSVGVKKTRHAIPAGLFADLVAVIVSVIVCRWMFA
ncbi:MAG: spore maturation protein [Acidobacteriota bacterium]